MALVTVLTREEWEKIRGPWRVFPDGRPPFVVMGIDLDKWCATPDALFEYREGTRNKCCSKYDEDLDPIGEQELTNEIAKELGLE
jgi:hypothetical protein